jgi:hypothetical protein
MVRGGRRELQSTLFGAAMVRGGSFNRRCLELQWCTAGGTEVRSRCSKVLLPELQAANTDVLSAASSGAPEPPSSSAIAIL